MAFLDYLPKLKRGLGIASGAHSLDNFLIKMFVIQYSSNGQTFNAISFFLHTVSNKMGYHVLILTVVDAINCKIYTGSISYLILNQWTKFQCHIFFPSYNTEQNGLSRSYFDSC